MDQSGQLLGGIEAGGTKFLCGVTDMDGNIVSQTRISTTDPVTTLGLVDAFFENVGDRHGPIAALSIGSFGPLSLQPTASDYGAITSTPKKGWQDVPLVRHFENTLDVPIAIDTDVNCAAVGEHLFGSGKGLDTFAYVTVGTGVGVGLFVNSAPHGGANHPEAGHIRLPRAKGDTDFAGICPFHGDCLEGMTSGPALAARWGQPAESLPYDHDGWRIAADYIAGLCATLTYVVRPDRIILGGGVMQSASMHERVRHALIHQLAGYDASIRQIDMMEYVVPPSAGSSAGLTGALAIAYRKLTRRWPAHWQISSSTASAMEHSVDA
ncbi:ROK family protein [Sphingobium sp. CR2-8]|uniref:ROK family protein n=1 Tax=Sphingobium sp. CR2-8 TaxID=1306534 RepID=UPI002DB5E7F1|nr:ROK family protein [Sphingobium sp. CR2-8]MEC3910032.1 ROK family protein [Sphingobium sp. CR2-8]